MKKYITILLTILSLCLIIFNAGCFNNNSNNDSSTSIIKKVELVGTPQMNVEYNSYLGYSAEITGTLKNYTSRAYSYVQIEFSVYDSEGNNLGTAIANMNNLQSGDTWKFSASLLSFPDTQPASFKLIDISCF